MKVKVKEMDRIALVDSGCSSSVVSRMLYRPEEWKSTTVLTVGKKCLLSHGVGSITLIVTYRNPLKMNMLVVNSKPLGFDLLLGMDVIKKLGGVHIDEGGKAHFAEVAHTLGATIELEHVDAGQAHTVGNFCLYWWCVCGREHCACGTCEGASLQLWPPQQGDGEATRWCVSA